MMKRLITVLLIAACGGSVDSVWDGTIETLPNGAVRVTNGAEGIWREGTGWRLEPDVTIGTIDGAEATVFASISGLEAGVDGRIYVLDRQANELRIFGPDGTHIRSVGRQGGGPGEYASANGLRWLTSDTLLVIDQQGNRYSILTSDGDYVRSIPRKLPFYGWVFDGGQVDGMVYESYSIGSDEDRQPALLATRLSTDSPGTLVVATDAPVPDRSTVDTILLPQTTAPPFESFSVRTDRAGMVIGVPFAPEAVYHVVDDSAVWHGHGSEFRLVRTTFDGDTTMEIVVDAEPTPVTTEERQEWLAGDGVKRFREMGGDLDESRIPLVKPYFDDMYLDPEGHLWVSIPSASQEMTFAVFDPDGRYLGRLHASGFERNEYVPPVVRDGRLYVVGSDDLGVQRVHVFRIMK